MSTIANCVALCIGNRNVLIDEEDVEKVSAHRWSLFDNRRGHVYAQANVRIEGKTGPRALRLHRFVLGLSFGDRRIVDHINGNTLDNRKANLRIVSAAANNINSKRVHSGPFKAKNGWIVRTQRNGVKQYHGFFKDYDQAVAVFRQVVGGEYAR